MAPRGGILGYHGVCSLSQHAERCIGPTVDVRNHKGVQMDTGLAGKVVLITGATRNHGRASALAFAHEGAHLLLCTRRSMDLLEETAALASKSDVRVVTERCEALRHH